MTTGAADGVIGRLAGALDRVAIRRLTDRGYEVKTFHGEVLRPSSASPTLWNSVGGLGRSKGDTTTVMADVPTRTPPGDLDRASIARVYDASLDGKDNFPVDRAALDEILKVAPHQRDVSKMNRYWLERMVTWLADRVGIDQFIDLGCGFPTRQNTHQVAQRHNLDARVVYVDNDPLVCAHGRALLATNRHTLFVEADLTDPVAVLAHPNLRDFLSFKRPIALMQVGTLHHVPDELRPADIMGVYVDGLPRGSFVAATHFWDPGEEDPDLSATARELEHAFTQLGLGSGYYRPRAEVAALFGGLKFVEPGLVGLDDWWPGGPQVRPLWPEERLILGGLARKNKK